MENLQKFYINGEWVTPQSKNTMPVMNPATEEQIGIVAMGNVDDVNLAVSAANTAFEIFSPISIILFKSFPLFINFIFFEFLSLLYAVAACLFITLSGYKVNCLRSVIGTVPHEFRKNPPQLHPIKPRNFLLFML